VLDLPNPAAPTFATVLYKSDFNFDVPQAVAIAGNYIYVGSGVDAKSSSIIVLEKQTQPLP
jgi:hypothetical protein